MTHIHLDQAFVSIDRFAERRPAGIDLAHFGLVPDGRAAHRSTNHSHGHAHPHPRPPSSTDPPSG